MDETCQNRYWREIRLIKKRMRMIYYRIITIGLALLGKMATASIDAFADVNQQGTTLCPAVMPKNEDACPQGSYFECLYDELCCEGNGNCVPIYQCDCSETAWCNDANIGLSCPFVCPSLPPMEGDACDINPLYLCLSVWRRSGLRRPLLYERL